MSLRERAGFGEFLTSITHPEESQILEPETPEERPTAIQKSAERYFLPQRVKRLEQRLKNQRTSVGGCELVQLVAAAKHHFPPESEGYTNDEPSDYWAKRGYSRRDDGT